MILCYNCFHLIVGKVDPEKWQTIVSLCRRVSSLIETLNFFPAENVMHGFCGDINFCCGAAISGIVFLFTSCATDARSNTAVTDTEGQQTHRRYSLVKLG